MDTLLLPNEMCGEGLTQTDGEDYRIPDCEAGRQSAGGGAHLGAADPSLIRRSGREGGRTTHLLIRTTIISCAYTVLVALTGGLV